MNRPGCHGTVQGAGTMLAIVEEDPERQPFVRGSKFICLFVGESIKKFVYVLVVRNRDSEISTNSATFWVRV